VNTSELSQLLKDCPTLYHMAACGSWPSIRKNGLMSTSALLDHYKISDDKRLEIEARRRPKSIVLENRNLGHATIRDQLPMDDKGLKRCLQDALTPEDWYRSLNAKVFFWLTRQRLLRLLGAGTYRLQEHDVLELDAASLVSTYSDQIWFCPINSGCTKPFPHPRGSSTFARITDYPYADWKTRRPRGERVVELAVDYSVPDAAQYVTRVTRMQGSQEIEILFEA
jgi:hypothetical protein